jgi:hypothetical protein
VNEETLVPLHSPFIMHHSPSLQTPPPEYRGKENYRFAAKSYTLSFKDQRDFTREVAALEAASAFRPGGAFRRGAIRLRWCYTFLLCLLFPAYAALAQTTQKSPDSNFDWNAARQFWSFRKPKVRPQPAVKQSDWPRQPLDYFVLARIEEAGLSPSAPADRITMIRRITFDLTGLPPTPDEVNAFLADGSADAYERLVDRLLVSAAFGQHLASMWLPLARYGEDQAHQVGSDTQFFYPNAYKYRQWVIDAFNRDLPYDQFIAFQLAADRMNAAVVDLPALGFIGLGPKYYNRNRLDVMSDEWEDRVDTVARTFLGLTVGCARCHDHKFDPITQSDYYALAGVFASTRMVNKTVDGTVLSGKVTADKMPPDTMHIVEEGEPKDLPVYIRGDVERPAETVPRRFIRILCDSEPQPFHDGSGRKELAMDIASRDNPLTARVMANRVWGLLTGKPIVATPSNFGHSGIAPTDQALLDHLAIRFMDSGWSVKSLVREIVLSATYRQSSDTDQAKVTIDAASERFWRMNRRRLTIEQWRDAVLTVCGELDPQGGRSLELDDPKNLRRTVYARVSRLKLNDFLMQFDYPDANVHAERRAITTTPMQGLFMLNSPFLMDRARALAAKLTADANETDEQRIDRAYRLLVARAPRKAEIDLALEFLHKPTSAELTRWQQYAQMLLACDEMLYVD